MLYHYLKDMISVIIATRNGSAYIERAIRSALSQSAAAEGLEILVVCDGCTDDTAAIARSLAGVRVIELAKNIGPGLARNLAVLGGEAEGIRHEGARGEYIAFLDDDDRWINPEKLARQKAFLDAHPDIAAVGSEKTEFVDEQGRHMRWIVNETDPERMRSNMLSYNPIITSSAMIRKDAFAAIGGFRDMHLAEDYDLWLRLGKTGKLSNVKDAETAYTVRSGGASGSRRREMLLTLIRLAKEYRGSYPGYPKAILKAYARLLLFIIKNPF